MKFYLYEYYEIYEIFFIILENNHKMKHRLL